MAIEKSTRLIGEREDSIDTTYMNELIREDSKSSWEQRNRKLQMETQIALLLDLHRMESAAYGNCAGEDLQKTEERLDPPLLKYYRKIKQRRGFGVAIQKDRTCSGCRMVYPEAHSIVQCSDLIHKCEYCGRLLVASDEIVLTRPHSEAPVAATYHIEPAEDNIDPAQDSEESWEEPETVILHADDDQAY